MIMRPLSMLALSARLPPGGIGPRRLPLGCRLSGQVTVDGWPVSEPDLPWRGRAGLP
jgi:hypothetical protein